ncbi:UDP-arabinose 4-epimerase 1 [Tanacetum coccineum]
MDYSLMVSFSLLLREFQAEAIRLMNIIQSRVTLSLAEEYYHYITSNTLVALEAMAAHNVNSLIYSSMCATYGEPEKMPMTEESLQVHHGPWEYKWPKVRAGK